MQWLANDEPVDGVLLFKKHAPSHVHMAAAKFTPVELLRLLHVRLGHPSNAVLRATCQPKISVGHDFPRITQQAFDEFCKLGCSVCNKVFAKATPRNKSESKRDDELPLMLMDSFGPVRVPSVYHNYKYANTLLHGQSRYVYTEGAQSIPEPVLEQVANAFRAVLRPHVGEIAALRTDAIKQTTTAKKWKEYARSESPFVAESAPGGKHHPLGLVEHIHKEAWPMVLADLATARRGLKWWYV
jgi:hypothetical protein